MVSASGWVRGFRAQYDTLRRTGRVNRCLSSPEVSVHLLDEQEFLACKGVSEQALHTLGKIDMNEEFDESQTLTQPSHARHWFVLFGGLAGFAVVGTPIAWIMMVGGAMASDDCAFGGDPRFKCTGAGQWFVALLPPAGLAIGLVVALVAGLIAGNRDQEPAVGLLLGVPLFVVALVCCLVLGSPTGT